MNPLTKMMHCDGSTDRITYQRNIALLGLGKALADLMSLQHTGAESSDVMHAWLNPYVLIAPWWNCTVPWFICATTVLLYSGVVWNTVHRLRDAGAKHWLGLLVCIPYAGPLTVAIACFMPTRRHTVWDLV
jgi:uncharacterized membrane protein YhaH (DUF805 family)